MSIAPLQQADSEETRINDTPFLLAIVDKVSNAMGYGESASENLADLGLARYSPT
jgi:restriction endonuclease Mrr